MDPDRSPLATTQKQLAESLKVWFFDVATAALILFAVGTTYLLSSGCNSKHESRPQKSGVDAPESVESGVAGLGSEIDLSSIQDDAHAAQSLKQALGDFPASVLKVETSSDWVRNSDGVTTNVQLSVDEEAYQDLLKRIQPVLLRIATASGSGWLGISRSGEQVAYNYVGLPDSAKSRLLATMTNTSPDEACFLFVAHSVGKREWSGGETQIIVDWYLIKNEAAKALTDVWSRLEELQLNAQLVDRSGTSLAIQLEQPFRLGEKLIRTPGGISRSYSWGNDVDFIGTHPAKDFRQDRSNSPVLILPVLVAPTYPKSNSSSLSLQKTSQLQIRFTISAEDALRVHKLQVSLQ